MDGVEEGHKAEEEEEAEFPLRFLIKVPLRLPHYPISKNLNILMALPLLLSQLANLIWRF